MKTSLWIILLLMTIIPFGTAQTLDKVKLDRYFDTLAQHNKFMGSVAIAQDGQLIYTKSVGFADVAKQVKANNQSTYRIGSISKTYTAVLVFKAVEAGKLNLNQTIDKFFPTITHADTITILQLLGHRSGIHNFTDNEDYLTWHTQPKTEAEMIAIIVKGGSDFVPGSKGEYSNSNYVLLAYILEKSFEKPYQDLLEEYIIKPTGLKNTYSGGQRQGHECISYEFDGYWQPQPETNMSIPIGAGSIVATPQDIITFGTTLFSGKLISLAHLNQMMTIQDGYGMGLFQFPFNEKKAWGHTGGIDGFSSMWGHFPEEKLAFALTGNGVNMTTNDIAIAVLNAAFDKPYDIPEFKTFDIAVEELDKYTGVYTSAQFPMSITIGREDNTLTAQATGQAAFLLQPTEKDKFSFDRAGVILEFNPAEKRMVLKQGGGEFSFTKN